MNGAEIRALREKIGLKRPQLCERAGPPLTVAKLAGIETGRDPRYDELQALQTAFSAFEAGRQFLAGEIKVVTESPKLADTRQKSDPSMWTSENPTIEAKLSALTKGLQAGRGRKPVTMVPNPKFVKFESWAGLEKGERVRIKSKTFDEPGKDNWEKGTFTFLQRVLNKETNDSWIDVVGGPTGKYARIQVRSFTEDRVLKFPKTKG